MRRRLEDHLTALQEAEGFDDVTRDRIDGALYKNSWRRSGKDEIFHPGEVIADEEFENMKSGIIREVLDHYKTAAIAAQKPKPQDPQTKALADAVQLHLIDKPTLDGRGKILKLLRDQGLMPKDAAARFAEIVEQTGASLYSLRPGTRLPADLQAPRDFVDDLGSVDGKPAKQQQPARKTTRADQELEKLADEAMTSLAAQGKLYRLDPELCDKLLGERGIVIGMLAAGIGTKDHRRNPYFTGNKKAQAALERSAPDLAAQLKVAAGK